MLVLGMVVVVWRCCGCVVAVGVFVGEFVGLRLFVLVCTRSVCVRVCFHVGVGWFWHRGVVDVFLPLLLWCWAELLPS